MNLHHLVYVVEISRCGSINKAARNLHLSQPNLSACIRNLEDELGFSIFLRKNSGIAITPEGEMLLASAEVILLEREKIRRIPDAFAKNRNLSISCASSSFLMQSFIDFKASYPTVSLQDAFKETGLIQTVRDVVEQNYRLSIIYFFDIMRKKHQEIAERYNLEMELLGTGIPVMVMVSKRHPLAGKESISCQDIGKYSIAAFENFDYEDWLGPLGIKNTGNVLYMFDRGGMQEVIQNSNYIAVVMAYRPPHGCVYIPLSDCEPRLELCLLHPKSYHLNQRENQLMRYLKKSLAENEILCSAAHTKS